MVNIGSSIVRRDGRDTEEVLRELRRNGWMQVREVGNRVFYMESAGFSLTVVNGPTGTLVFPSGPIRGRLFGSSGLEVSRDGNLMDKGLDRLPGNLGSRMRGGFLRGRTQEGGEGDESGSSSDESNNSSESSSNNDDVGGEAPQPNRKNARTSGAGDFV